MQRKKNKSSVNIGQDLYNNFKSIFSSTGDKDVSSTFQEIILDRAAKIFAKTEIGYTISLYADPTFYLNLAS